MTKKIIREVMMNKIKGFFFCKVLFFGAVIFSFSAFAGDGHDHGNSAFENSGMPADEFELSSTQINNLKLSFEPAQVYTFYETVKAPMILDTMHDSRPLAHGFIYEGTDIMKVRTGQEVSFTLDALPDQTFRGRIVRAEEMLDPQTRLYSVYADIPAGVPQKGQGLKGEMEIKIMQEEQAIGVPETAVQGEFGEYYVFIRHGSHFERRPVVIGNKTAGMVKVIGVHEGEEVVTTGSYQLRYAQGKSVKDGAHDEDVEDIENAEHANDAHPANDIAHVENVSDNTATAGE